MSLLSTDITKVKRLSLREVKLPAPERRVEPVTTIQVERPPTAEEIAFSNLVARSPILELLVERLQLVSITTGKPFKKVKLPERGVEGYNEEARDEVVALIQKLLDKDTLYKKEDIIESLSLASKVDINRAEEGFDLIVKAGAIELTPENNYYLTGSSINRINTVI